MGREEQELAREESIRRKLKRSESGSYEQKLQAVGTTLIFFARVYLSGKVKNRGTHVYKSWLGCSYVFVGWATRKT